MSSEFHRGFNSGGSPSIGSKSDPFDLGKTDLDEFAVLSIHSENIVLVGVGLDHNLGYVLVTGA